MLGNTGAFLTGKLPYDAEVEYLQSTGLQWIDTGVFHNFVNAVRFKMAMPNTDGHNYMGVYAAYNGEANRCTRIIYTNNSNSGDILVYHGSVAGSQGVKMTPPVSGHIKYGAWLEGYTSNSGYHINGASGTANPGTPGIASVTMKLFYSNSSGPAYAAGSKFAYFKIDNQIDLVPVRFTNELGQSEGAMYDRANPTVGMNPDGSARTDGLYRNRGTGAFTIGPDKTA